MFDRENECQGQVEQRSQWCHSMANINLCESHMTHFATALTVFEILMFQICDLENLGQVTECNNGPIRWQKSISVKVNLDHFSTWSTTFAMVPLTTSIKVMLQHCSLVLTVFAIFTFQNAWPWKCRSRLWCTTIAVAPFDGKYVLPIRWQ